MLEREVIVSVVVGWQEDAVGECGSRGVACDIVGTEGFGRWKRVEFGGGFSDICRLVAQSCGLHFNAIKKPQIVGCGKLSWIIVHRLDEEFEASERT